MSRKNRSRKERNRTAHRNIMFVDIENYVGHPVLSRSDVEDAKRELTSRFGLGVRDMVVVGTSHELNFVNAKLAWQGPRHVLRRGHDGADIALVDAAADYDVTSYDTAYIVSGDGYFADLAARIAQTGTEVVVARGNSSLSRKFENVRCALA